MREIATIKALKITSILLFLFPTVGIGADLLAQKGSLDLTQWWGYQRGVLPLNGEWEFYSHRFFSPGDLRRSEEQKEWITLPKSWNSTLLRGNKKMGPYGYGTYRLMIKTPVSDQVWGLWAERISSAYKVWVNGKLMVERGRLGTDRELEDAVYIDSHLMFPDVQGKVEIVVQVSNFRHRKGGIREKIYFGTSQNIAQLLIRKKSQYQLNTALFILSALYSLIIFYVLRKEPESRAYLCFGMLSINFALFFTFFHQFGGFFLNLPWEVSNKVNYYSYLFVPILYIMYLDAQTPTILPKYFLKTNQLFIIGLAFVVLFTNSTINHYTLTLYYIHAVMILFVAFFVFYRVYSKKLKEIYRLIPSFIFLVFATNDALFSNELIQTGRFLHVGILFFIYISFFNNTIQFSCDFLKLKKKNQELEIKKKKLGQERLERRKLQQEIEIEKERVQIEREDRQQVQRELRLQEKEKNYAQQQFLILEIEMAQEQVEASTQIQKIQQEHEKIAQATLSHSQKLIGMLEEKEESKLQKYEIKLQEFVMIVERIEEKLARQSDFLEKVLQIEKVLYIERKKDEKICIIHHENGTTEAMLNFTLKEFYMTFSESLLFCNRSILVNIQKQFFLEEHDKNRWNLGFKHLRFEITKHNFRSLRDTFASMER